MDAPEPYTNAWYRQQYLGINHRLNQQANELLDQYTANNELQKKIAALETKDERHVAKIGELIGRVEELEKWMAEIERIRQERAKANGTK